MCCENNTAENPGYLEKLGYTYDDWQEIYTKEMSSGLSVGYISDWGGWHYYLEIERLTLGDEAVALLSADFKELKDDFNAFINDLKEVCLKEDPSLEFYLDEFSNKIRIRRSQT